MPLNCVSKVNILVFADTVYSLRAYRETGMPSYTLYTHIVDDLLKHTICEKVYIC